MASLGAQRTLEVLRASGFAVDIAERVLPTRPRPTRKDLFGFVDLVAVRMKFPQRVKFLQVTGAGNGLARVKKILEGYSEVVRALLASATDVEVWSWNKYKPRGTKRVRWEARRWKFMVKGGEVVALELEGRARKGEVVS